MREIKFRGYKSKAHKWIYGNYAELIESSFIGIIDEEANWHNVIPETVGQFTGLLDKNGKEIYEGDIVRHKQYVEWGKLSEHIDLVRITPNCGAMVGDNSIGRELEVLGNIHDNPELLKGGYTIEKQL